MEKVSLRREKRNKEPAGWEVSGTSQQRQQQILQAGSQTGVAGGHFANNGITTAVDQVGIAYDISFPRLSPPSRT